MSISSNFFNGLLASTRMLSRSMSQEWFFFFSKGVVSQREFALFFVHPEGFAP